MGRQMKKLCILFFISICGLVNAQTRNIWQSQADIDILPMSGPGWTTILSASKLSTFNPVVSNQDDNTDVYLIAKALVWRRTGSSNTQLYNEIVATLKKAIGTESGGRTLALGRNLIGYVISADLIGYRDPVFVAWVKRCQFEEKFTGGPATLRETHSQRPNNWGTHAGASRIASDIYLDDPQDLSIAVNVFHGWLGGYYLYHGFSYGDKSWQSNSNMPVGINPPGATIQGHNVDGVLPDDQRRGGSFSWPPPKENYVYEALQGALVQCELLHRHGYPSYEWQDKAVLRAFTWLNITDNFLASGDDRWQPWIVNKRYGSTFPFSTSATYGKNMGWTSWTHQ